MSTQTTPPPTLPQQQSGLGDEIGDMYLYWTLDSIIELAYAISGDFVNRPTLYQKVDENIVTTLVSLRMQYGTAPCFPNRSQRQAMNMPVFGRSDGQRPDNAQDSPFQLARKKLLDAAAAFAERVNNTGVDMLKQRVKSAIVPLRSHLLGADGASLKSSHGQMKWLFSAAKDILKHAAIAKVFGVEPPQGDWPEESEDLNGAKLVGFVSSVLKLTAESGVTQEKFILLERVATEGRDALKAVLNFKEEIVPVITTSYTWGASLRDYQS